MVFLVCDKVVRVFMNIKRIKNGEQIKKDVGITYGAFSFKFLKYVAQQTLTF